MYNGAGSLFALGMRVTKLDDAGNPLVGPENSYKTDALIQCQLGLQYEDGEEIIQRNGSGNICLTYRAPDSLTRGTITGLQVCTPDPNILSFMTGGNVLERNGDQVGYQAPEVGNDPNPNGFSLELWTRAIIDGAYSGYFWWVIPRAFVRPSGDWALSGENPLVPEFEGYCTQNPNWGDGPQNDWEFDSSRVWQYVQADTVPDLSRGFQPVEADLTVTSIALTPAAPAVTVGGTQQMTATATMSDSSERDVTDQADWSSDDTGIATVDNDTQKGLVTGVAAGSANVSATYGGQTGSEPVTVS